jgi:hypothetical protein
MRPCKTRRGEKGPDADCFNLKAELPFKGCSAFFLLGKGVLYEKVKFIFNLLCRYFFIYTLSSKSKSNSTAWIYNRDLRFRDTDSMELTVLEICGPCSIMQGDLDADGDLDGDDLRIFSQYYGTEPLTP